MAPKKEGGAAKRGNNKPYNRPDPIPNGEILTDLCNKKWRVGKSIGSGGFGDIYLASDEVGKTVNDKANFVVKIEPYTNGPLFVEIAFYIRVAKPDMIDSWKNQHKMDSIGMPWYVASGSHECKSQKYRFMVIPRFGQDLHKILQEKPGKRFALRTVQAMALQIIDTLEYIHSKDFVHGDIKASNLMVGLYNANGGKTKKQSQSQQIYLVDYGLATKYVNPDGAHAAYSPDARKAHNGTLEYTSRDAHIGAFSRRGDLEVLAYNMIEWLCGSLPWTNSEPPEKIHKQKQALMNDPNLKKLYSSNIQGIDILEKFLKYIVKLKFEDKPNYAQCKELIKKGLPSSPKGCLYLDDVSHGFTPAKSKTKAKAASKRTPSEVDDEPTAPKKFCLSDDEEESKRSTRTTHKVTGFNWTSVLSSDPEKLVRAAVSLSPVGNLDRDESMGSKPPSPIVENPTPAMLQILAKKKENIRSPIKAKFAEPEGNSILTPAMKEVMMRKKKSKSAHVNSNATAGKGDYMASSSTLNLRTRRNRTANGN